MWRESASIIIAAKSNFSQSTSCNYKILCLQRSKKLEFMPNAYVFPGGIISESDCSVRWLDIFKNCGYKLDSFEGLYPIKNIPRIFKNASKNCLPKYLSLRICAIRETFEECGILICKSPRLNYRKNTNWASYIGGRDILKWQHKIHNDPNEFLNLCSQLEIYPDVWSLHNWSNWMTPPSIPTRFNTMFFFSTFSQLPDVHKEEKEIQNIKWATPNEYCVLNNNKEIMFPIPQFYEISRLRNFNSIQILSKFSKERSNYGCEWYFPLKVATDAGLYNIFPGDDMYPNHIDKNNTSIMVLKKMPPCKIQNRLLIHGDYKMSLFVQNFIPKDKHLPPVGTNNSTNLL